MKKAFKQNSQESSDQELNESLSPQKGSNVVIPFLCACGKAYTTIQTASLHFQTKHHYPYKQYIKQLEEHFMGNRKFRKQSNNETVMQENDKFQRQLALMNITNKTEQRLSKYYFSTIIIMNLNEKHYNIVSELQNQTSDDYDAGIDNEARQIQLNRIKQRRKYINNKINDLKKVYQLEQINDYVSIALQLRSFKYSINTFNLKQQLSNYFHKDLAAQIEFSLELICIIKKHHYFELDPNLVQDIKSVLNYTYRSFPGILTLLQNYYEEWNNIRFLYKTESDNYLQLESQRQVHCQSGTFDQHINNRQQIELEVNSCKFKYMEDFTSQQNILKLDDQSY